MRQCTLLAAPTFPSQHRQAGSVQVGKVPPMLGGSTSWGMAGSGEAYSLEASSP